MQSRRLKQDGNAATLDNRVHFLPVELNDVPCASLNIRASNKRHGVA
ncbi:MAG TPA: hypothetical protein VGI46_21825 [Candidatus Acidoferrum sp.]